MRGPGTGRTAAGAEHGTGIGSRDFPMPDHLTESSLAWLADRQRPAVPARASATVLLVRDAAPGGVEVFVLVRAASMVFAPSMVAFPGGGVDESDADVEVPWAGPGPDWWARVLGCPREKARALVVAAAREVFEESGVLLAGPDAAGVVTDAAGWAPWRERVLTRELGFAQALRERGHVLRADLLRPRAHWTTPLSEPRRYDTWFFLARVPSGQEPDDRTSEATRAGWVRPADVLADHRAGRAALLPPTLVMLEQLAAAADAAGLMDEAVEVHPVLPVPARVGGRVVMRAPIGPDGHGLAPFGRSPAPGEGG